METEHENASEKLSEIKVQEDFEAPASITWMKQRYAKIQGLTTQKISDNLWVIGLKWFLKGIMVLILILISPFILIVLLFSLMIAG
jgi:hypothetical protein